MTSRDGIAELQRRMRATIIGQDDVVRQMIVASLAFEPGPIAPS